MNEDGISPFPRARLGTIQLNRLELVVPLDYCEVRVVAVAQQARHIRKSIRARSDRIQYLVPELEHHDLPEQPTRPPENVEIASLGVDLQNTYLPRHDVLGHERVERATPHRDRALPLEHRCLVERDERVERVGMLPTLVLDQVERRDLVLGAQRQLEHRDRRLVAKALAKILRVGRVRLDRKHASRAVVEKDLGERPPLGAHVDHDPVRQPIENRRGELDLGVLVIQACSLHLAHPPATRAVRPARRTRVAGKRCGS